MQAQREGGGREVKCMDSSVNIQPLSFKGMGAQRSTLIALLHLDGWEEEKISNFH